MQFLMRGHEGFSRVAFLEHTVKKEDININSDINKECHTQRPLTYFNNHNKERMKGEYSVIPHSSLILKRISLKLFLDMVSSPPAG